jgi:hypothetical protein
MGLHLRLCKGEVPAFRFLVCLERGKRCNRMAKYELLRQPIPLVCRLFGPKMQFYRHPSLPPFPLSESFQSCSIVVLLASSLFREISTEELGMVGFDRLTVGYD